MLNKQNIIIVLGILIISLSIVVGTTNNELSDSELFDHVQSVRAFESLDGRGDEIVTGSNESRNMYVIYSLIVNVSGYSTYNYQAYRSVPVIIDTESDVKIINSKYESAMKNYAKDKWNATLTKYVWQPYSKP